MATLAAMRKYSKPVAPKNLGVICGEHLKERFLAAGGINAAKA